MTKQNSTAADPSTKLVPLAANRFAAGPLKFAAMPEGSTDETKTPITLHARDGGPINHWYWGTVYHDMAGFESKPTIPLDYCHEDEEILGYLDTFIASDAGLDCSGMLVGFMAGDRVAEIKHKAANGVPYQASIFFDPLAIEEVLPGYVSQCNGQQVNGPASVIRKWTLRGVAVCPYGADANTESKFAASHRGEITVPTKFTKEPPTMATDATPNAPPVETPVDPRLAFAAELKRFTDRFGADAGTKFFTEQTSFEVALESHVVTLQTQLTERDAEIADLKTKLAAVDRGHPTPVQFNDGEAPPATPPALNAVNGVSPGLEKFAAGIKLPNAATPKK